MDGESYLARATRRVFSDGTLWWRAPALAALQLVPILNWFTTTGYVLMVMRDAAWGIDRGLPRFSEFKEILKNGVSGFVVSLVWSLVLVPVVMVALLAVILPSVPSIMNGYPAAPVFPWWFGPAIAAPSAFLSIFMYVAWLRTAVYVTSSAGLSVAGVRDLIRSNSTEFGRVAWLAFAAGLLPSILAVPGALLVQATNLPAGAASAISYTSSFVVGVLGVVMSLIAGAAYGTWASSPGPSSWPPLAQEPSTAGSSGPTEAAFFDSES
ncbi:DUF4013 domain-containing protein [bacterium]|nr:MAG: DUF4013 domain-containing protein [bacterium]